MPISENIELPKLTADEAWLDKVEISKGIKRLLYLPYIAYKTALYNNKNELSEYQTVILVLLFRDESEKAFEVVHNQVLLIVGNNPSGRLEYFKAFESWKERLIVLLKKSMDCITKEQFLKEIKKITNTLPSKEQLAIEGKLTKKGTLTVEGKNQFGQCLANLTKRGKEKVFEERIYWNKFSEYIIEAFILLRRFSVMHSITMENIEWTIKGLENIGKLPEDVKIALKKIKRTSQATKESQPQEKAGQGGTDDIAIDDKELTILIELAEGLDKTFSQVEIEAATSIPRGTLKDKLLRLENVGLIHRPLGKRKGYQITDKGREIAKRNE